MRWTSSDTCSVTALLSSNTYDVAVGPRATVVVVVAGGLFVVAVAPGAEMGTYWDSQSRYSVSAAPDRTRSDRETSAGSQKWSASAGAGVPKRMVDVPVAVHARVVAHTDVHALAVCVVHGSLVLEGSLLLLPQVPELQPRPPQTLRGHQPSSSLFWLPQPRIP